MSNIELFAGNTKKIQVTVKDVNGNPVNITNPTSIVFRVSENPVGRTSVNMTGFSIEKTAEQMDLTQTTTGIIKVTLYPEDTTRLLGLYFFEFVYTDVLGNIATLLSGNLNIKESLGNRQFEGLTIIYPKWERSWSVLHGTYKLGNIVSYHRSAYICIQEHDPELMHSQPEVGDSWTRYWDLMTPGIADSNGGLPIISWTDLTNKPTTVSGSGLADFDTHVINLVHNNIVDSVEIDFSVDSNNQLTAALKNSGVTAGTYGAVNKTLIASVDAHGRITSISAVNIVGLLDSNGAAGGGGGSSFDPTLTRLNTNGHTVANGDRLLIDTSAAAFSTSLPASPTLGFIATFFDGCGTLNTNNLTISRNGNTINGIAEDLVVDINGITFSLFWNGTTWMIG